MAKPAFASKFHAPAKNGGVGDEEEVAPARHDVGVLLVGVRRREQRERLQRRAADVERADAADRRGGAARQVARDVGDQAARRVEQIDVAVAVEVGLAIKRHEAGLGDLIDVDRREGDGFGAEEGSGRVPPKRSVRERVEIAVAVDVEQRLRQGRAGVRDREEGQRRLRDEVPAGLSKVRDAVDQQVAVAVAVEISGLRALKEGARDRPWSRSATRRRSRRRRSRSPRRSLGFRRRSCPRPRSPVGPVGTASGTREKPPDPSFR
jgi:hypothetical protein